MLITSPHAATLPKQRMSPQPNPLVSKPVALATHAQTKQSPNAHHQPSLRFGANIEAICLGLGVPFTVIVVGLVALEGTETAAWLKKQRVSHFP